MIAVEAKAWETYPPQTVGTHIRQGRQDLCLQVWDFSPQVPPQKCSGSEHPGKIAHQFRVQEHPDRWGKANRPPPGLGSTTTGQIQSLAKCRGRNAEMILLICFLGFYVYVAIYWIFLLRRKFFTVACFYSCLLCLCEKGWTVGKAVRKVRLLRLKFKLLNSLL